MALGVDNSAGIQKSIGQKSEKVGGNLGKLASGMRINRAVDDSAGLAVSEKLRADLSSLAQATNNVSAGSSMLRTAEGALSQIGGMLGRARELAVQSANGTLDDSTRQTINREFDAILEEINRISATTEFNGQQLLTGELGPDAPNPVTIQVGINDSPGDRITISAVGNTDIASLGLTGVAVYTAENALNALGAIDNAIGQITADRAGVGAVSNRFEAAAANISVTRENLTSAESQIRDLDYAKESSEQSKNQILLQSGINSLQQNLKQQKNLLGGLLDIKT